MMRENHPGRFKTVQQGAWELDTLIATLKEEAELIDAKEALQRLQASYRSAFH